MNAARWLSGCLIVALACTLGIAAESKPLSDSLEAFKEANEHWSIVGGVKLDPANARKLMPEAGAGILFSDGQGNNLETKQSYRDCQIDVEFMVPKGSNAGIKLNGVYEIQILDSWGKTKLTGSDCGGIYPRAELKPRYRTIDEGTPPRVNASRQPGEWQTMKIVFRGPRFDASGTKTANARFERVELNGQVVQENQEAATPTGHIWRNKEKPQGPVLLQGDHGPVALRNLRIAALEE
jgi:hypothetical protein